MAETADRLIRTLGNSPNGPSHKDVISMALEYEAASFDESLADNFTHRFKLPAPWFVEDRSVVRALLSRLRRKYLEPKKKGRVKDRATKIVNVMKKASNLIGTDSAVQTWLNIPNPDIDFKTPQQLIDDGHLNTLEELIDAGLEGDIG